MKLKKVLFFIYGFGFLFLIFGFQGAYATVPVEEQNLPLPVKIEEPIPLPVKETNLPLPVQCNGPVCRTWDVGLTGEPPAAKTNTSLGYPAAGPFNIDRAAWHFCKEKGDPKCAISLLTKPEDLLTRVAGAFSDDGIGWLIARQILHMFTEEIVSWIQTGQFGGGPLFTTDIVGSLFDVADNAAGHFLAQYKSEEWYNLLCAPFRPHVYLALGRGRVPYIERARCTVTDIVSNLEDFYSDFSNGGWAAWFSTIEPQNNPYGLHLLSLGEKEHRESEATFAYSFNVKTGRGFLGLQKCKAGGEIKPGESGYAGNGTDSFCPPKNRIIVTPGSFIQDKLEVATNKDLDKLGVADELNEIIVAAFDKLLSWLVSGGSGGGGLLAADLPDPEPIEPICSQDTGRPNGCGCTIATQCALNFCSPANICEVPFALAECNDRVDNDDDRLVDFPTDPQCTSAEDTSEGEAGQSQELAIVSTTLLPSGRVGAAYNFQFLAEGGTPLVTSTAASPYVWGAVDTGAHPLPAGLTLSPIGTLSGTSTAAGTWTFIVKATDSVASSTQGTFLLTVVP